MKNYQNKQKIIKVSKIIRAILFAGLVLWIACGASVLLAQGALQLWVKHDPAMLYTQGGVVGLMILCFITNLHLFRFFDRLKNGFLFDAQTVRHLDAAGKWWIALWFCETIFYEIGHGFSHISNAWGVSNLFAGLALIFVAWLFKEAQELQTEQELTV